MILFAACAGPIGVDRADPGKVHRRLTASALSTGELSLQTRNLLRRANLLALYERDPVRALDVAHDGLIRGEAQNERREVLAQAVVGLAEASFLHASESGDRRYFFMTAIYAWLYLFSPGPHGDPLDPRIRLAADLYNRALTLAVLSDERRVEGSAVGAIEFEAGQVELPIGVLDVRFDEAELEWGARHFTSFAPVSELLVRGMRNRYRDPGLGAPFAASTDSPPLGRADSDLVYDEVRVPVSVLLVFDDLSADLAEGTIRAHLEIHSGTGPAKVEILGRLVPLEVERTSTLALMMTESAPWTREIRGFFQGDLARTREGLVSLAPHQPGRIPIFLVHGTASSSATWANFVNDLSADSEIREAYEFWLFTYNTGAPIAYSAWLLRRAIDDMIETIDPERVDPALQQAVVIGHSQGGLLTKLMSVDSGDSFWRSISDQPLAEMNISDKSRKILEGSLFVKPHPAVKQVVFISTPHRGSFLALYAAARWIGSLVRAPANVVRVVSDIATSDPDAAAVRKIDNVDGAIGNMSPNSNFLKHLVDLPISADIEAHSIISVKDLGDIAEGSDGVVKYQSAHLAGVDSEVLVESGHSCLSHPDVITEARRILRTHLLATRHRSRD